MKNQLLNALRVVLMLLIPTLTFAQAPPLGTAADFVLFTSVGAVTNVGTYKYLTHLTGNVGTNSGSSTNFGNVNGVMHDGDGASGTCASDVLLAYNTLGAAIPDSTLGSVIGNGTTLKAHTYLMPGATSLNLGLTLDAQGNSNAVFIFKTPTAVAYAFTANPNSKIHLINGAQACNVFWQVSGAVDLGAGTTFRGTIIAHGAISMAAQDTLEGRALTVNGAITVSNGAIGLLAYTPIGCGTPVLIGPAAPTFVASGSYAVFATTGAASDCGTSRIIGDVGGNTVPPTGFNPDSVTGGIHFNDPSTNAAAADLLLVFNYLLGLPYDIKLLDPAEFGHNLVLTPHTYQMDAAVTLTDTLYLNALGNTNAVFVIKSFGAFATTVGSKIILINGTQSKNVYWFCSAAVSITANSIFKGAIIAHDAIEMLPGSKLDGRVFSTNGALTTCGITASLPSPISAGPDSQTACSGSSVSLSITASGTSLTYQWRKGTVNLIDAGNISGANSATLTFNPVNISDAALNYNVTVVGPSTPAFTSNNASITVNPLPAAVAGVDRAICLNASTTLGAASVTGSTYSWTSVPAGFISTLSNPLVTPLVTTTYTVVESVTATGCTNTHGVLVTVNPLPAAVAGVDRAICLNASTTLGAASVTGSTYSWTSVPAGFISTLSNPLVTPLVTTTYTVVESVTATG
ncbi:MAG: ice-binding family protein, partial [Bacteroidales bacterium]|nr:ice-binding family protein [Bacteroidales bacterium]